MLALAPSTDRDQLTRAANDDSIFGGPGTRTKFVYDEAGHLIGEYDGSGNLVQETVWMRDTPVATLRPNGGGISIFYVHVDHLNAPRRISRPSDNAILWRWDSDPFGTDAANEDADADSNLFKYGLRFPGQYSDLETGLDYNYFRDYDPASGRYIESDPVGLEGGINTFGYADANPVGASDPLGLKAEICCRYLNSGLGFVVTPRGAFGLFQRHCYAVVDGTIYSLFPRDGIGRPTEDNREDERSYPSKARCKECKQKTTEPCVSTGQCVKRFTEGYPVSSYWFLGPNSNTYAGQLARTCCEGGIPQGLGSAPGLRGVRPFTPPTRFVPNGSGATND